MTEQQKYLIEKVRLDCKLEAQYRQAEIERVASQLGDTSGIVADYIYGLATMEDVERELG